MLQDAVTLFGNIQQGRVGFELDYFKKKMARKWWENGGK